MSSAVLTDARLLCIFPYADPGGPENWMRVLRAFYRRQIISNAWAPTGRTDRLGWMGQDMAALSNTSEHKGMRLGLSAVFKPWELQQVDHVDYFITRLCAALRLAGEAEEIRASRYFYLDYGEARFALWDRRRAEAMKPLSRLRICGQGGFLSSPAARDGTISYREIR